MASVCSQAFEKPADAHWLWHRFSPPLIRWSLCPTSASVPVLCSTPTQERAWLPFPWECCSPSLHTFMLAPERPFTAPTPNLRFLQTGWPPWNISLCVRVKPGDKVLSKVKNSAVWEMENHFRFEGMKTETSGGPSVTGNYIIFECFSAGRSA